MRLIKSENTCEECQNKFKPWRKNSVYCSRTCANVASGRKSAVSNGNTCLNCGIKKEKKYFTRISRKNRMLYSKNCTDCRSIIKNNKLASRPWYYKRAYTMFHNAKQRATAKNMEFTISIEDVIIPEKCPVFGTNFREEYKKDNKYFTHNYTPSIDRIKNDEGYTKDNIVIVSCRANSIKGDASIEELQKILNFYKFIEHHQ